MAEWNRANDQAALRALRKLQHDMGYCNTIQEADALLYNTIFDLEKSCK